MKSTSHITRRSFLKNATGIGVRGGSLVEYLARLKSAKIVAISDVYKPHMQKGVKRSKNTDVKTYLDYRDVLADKNVDAVVIATPDIRHSTMVIEAANAGKDIYCEKGFSVTGGATGSTEPASQATC